LCEGGSRYRTCRYIYAYIAGTSPILFAIYLSGVFNEVEEEGGRVSRWVSFVDDVCWVARGRGDQEARASSPNCNGLGKPQLR
jgi:hypothetical protein